MARLKVNEIDLLAMMDLYSDRNNTPSPYFLADLFGVTRQNITNKTKKLEENKMIVRLRYRNKSNRPIKTHKITPKGIRALKE